jgi:CUB domain
LISGSLYNESSSGVLTSPFFPYFYPKDYGVEYIISCPTEANCRVRIIFQDFQLASQSIMEFYDGNKTGNKNRMEVSSGGVFRPPVILTTRPTMTVRFYANGGTGLGYKAIYSFVSRTLKDEIIKPITGMTH